MDKQVRQRGKSKISIEEMDARGIYHENGWVFGIYMDGYILTDVLEVDDDYIVIGQWCAVYEDSVGLFTGHKDINGIDIYENDYVLAELYVFPCYYKSIVKVMYSKEDGGFNMNIYNMEDITVVGNTVDGLNNIVNGDENYEIY